jgi:hypothetical protein
MDFPFRYCSDGLQRLERLRELYEEHPQDRVFARMEDAFRQVQHCTREHRRRGDTPRSADRGVESLVEHRHSEPS